LKGSKGRVRKPDQDRAEVRSRRGRRQPRRTAGWPVRHRGNGPGRSKNNTRHPLDGPDKRGIRGSSSSKNGLGTAAQLAAVGIEGIIRKYKLHVRAAIRALKPLSRNNQAHLKDKSSAGQSLLLVSAPIMVASQTRPAAAQSRRGTDQQPT
jgi:hypothetical protein